MMNSPKTGSLKLSLLSHLMTSAQVFLTGGTVCNFLIHSSICFAGHKAFAEKVGTYLNELSQSIDEDITKDALKMVYDDLSATKTDMLNFDKLYDFIKAKIHDDDSIKILTLNSKVSIEDNTQYEDGINIIFGGNS